MLAEGGLSAPLPTGAPGLWGALVTTTGPARLDEDGTGAPGPWGALVTPTGPARLDEDGTSGLLVVGSNGSKEGMFVVLRSGARELTHLELREREVSESVQSETTLGKSSGSTCVSSSDSRPCWRVGDPDVAEHVDMGHKLIHGGGWANFRGALWYDRCIHSIRVCQLVQQYKVGRRRCLAVAECGSDEAATVRPCCEARIQEERGVEAWAPDVHILVHVYPWERGECRMPRLLGGTVLLDRVAGPRGPPAGDRSPKRTLPRLTAIETLKLRGMP